MKRFLSNLMAIALIVTLAGPAQSVSAATIKLNHTNANVIKGNYLYLKVSGTKSKVSWNVNDYSIATITTKGQVTATKIGSTTITAKVGKKILNCKITVVPKPYPSYVTDSERDLALAERNYIDKYKNEKTDDVEVVTKPAKDSSKDAEARIEKMLKYGFSDSKILDKPIGKQYMKFCDTWVSEYELDKYDASVNEFNNKLYITLDTDTTIVLENVPDKLEAGTVYTISDVKFQYLKDFTYDNDKFSVNQFYFDRQDLISKGFIE